MELDMSQEIGQVLDELAARFGTVGAELWTELVRYQVVGTITQAILCLVAVLIGFFVLYWGRQKYKETNDEGYGIAVGLGGLATLISGIAFFTSLWYLAVILAAPQAATLKALLP